MKGQFKRLLIKFKKPEYIILFSLLIIFGYLIIFPLFSIVKDTVTIHANEITKFPGNQIGDITLEHWKRVLSVSDRSLNTFYIPLLNSILVALGVCVGATALGGSLAWLVTRTNIPFKGFISTVFMFGFIMPSWTLAMAWLNFFKNSHLGGAPGIFESITGIEPADWLSYGFLPIVITLSVHYGPFAYIFIGGILRNMDSSLEESAEILQANRFQIIRRITLPMILPGLMTTFLLVFANSISTFAVPAFLGGPVNFSVLSLELYRTLGSGSPGTGYIYAIVLIALGVCLLLFNQWFIGRRKSFTTIQGKSSKPSLIKLRIFKWPVTTIVTAFLTAISIIPILTFAYESFMLKPGDYSFSNFTTRFWVGENIESVSNLSGILKNSDLYNALFNSFSLSTLSAFIAGTLGLLAGYAMVKRRGSVLAKIVDNLTFIPYLIPGIGLAAVYLSMFIKPHGFIPALYGTFALLVLIGGVRYLTYGSQASSNSMLQMGNEIEEAAEIQGISWWKRMVKIIFPIQKSNILSGYVLTFITVMRELSLFVLLVTPSTQLLTTLMFDYSEFGWNQFSNAIILIIVVVVISSNFILNKLTGSSIEKGIGG